MKQLSWVVFFLLFFQWSNGQVVFQTTNASVYEFLDELANEKVIELNSIVKPYERRLISEKLNEAKEKESELTKRQQKELAFYLKDFGKELHPDKDFDRRFDVFYYKDSVFTFTVNPILGGKYYTNNTGDVFHRWNGGEAWAYAGKHLGFYASLRDNGVSQILGEYNFLTQMQGANYKLNQDGVIGGRSDYSEMIGGVSFSWDWGSLSIQKDNIQWGNNYHGANIFSGRAPSYAYINLKMNPVEWFDFNYVHGWLVSEVIDSSRSYQYANGYRKVMAGKFLAANMFTFKPVKNIFVSLGNSVIYSDNGINPAYLIPVMFYKSIDHTYNGTGSNDLGQNAQMFFDLSVRRLKHTHFYATMYVDEISLSNMWDAEKHSNLLSIKGGMQVSNLLPNTLLTLEYTRNNPWTFEHNVPTTTFASNQFNLGHYLRENAEEIYAGIEFRPIRGLRLKADYTLARKGPAHDYQIIAGVPNVKGLKFMESVDWQSKVMSFTSSYEVINDGFIYLQVASSDISESTTIDYTPDFYEGNQLTIVGGINFGF